MSSLKPEIHKLCQELAAEFENWNFVGDEFKNKTLKHTTLIVRPGFTFQGGGDNPGCSMQPTIDVANNKANKLYQEIFGVKCSRTSFMRFQTVRNLLHHYPENLRFQGYIWHHRQSHVATGGGKYEPWPKTWIGLDEARPAIKGMLMDGIDLIEKYYDLSSEENLLRNLPPKYVPAAGGNEEMEGGLGVMVCVTRILLGDFDFVEHYCSDDYKTLRPKRIKELDTVIAALPELKRRLAETGKII